MPPVKDVLAEDFVLGRAVVARLGKRVVLGRSVVTCVSVRRPLEGFFRRYARWNVMQHQCAGLAAYLGLLLENPGLLAAVAALVDPSVPSLALAATCCASRMATDALASCLLRGRCFSLQALLAGGAKDLLCGAAWIYGLVSRSIEWRSNRLVVLSGSRLGIASSGGRLGLPELIAERDPSGSRMRRKQPEAGEKLASPVSERRGRRSVAASPAAAAKA